MVDPLAVATHAAIVAGEYIKERFNRHRSEFTKADGSIVTEVDYGSEKIILSILKANFPEFDRFSEEAGNIDSDAALYKWFVDPLDGTTNFSEGLPYFCVSIALYRRLQEYYAPCLGVVYDPMHEELFSARSGIGAYCNGMRFKIKGKEDRERAVVVLSRGGTIDDKILEGIIFLKLSYSVRSIRVFNASALDICHVAAGRFDAFVANKCAFYDYAAGTVVAHEAGAVITDFQGREGVGGTSDILVCNHILHPQLVEIMRLL